MGYDATGVAIGTIAMAQANAAKHEAEIARCSFVVDRYDSKNYTVAEAHEYADCIDVLYPLPMSDGTILIFKILFVLGLIGAGIGIWKARKEDSHNGALEYFIYALMGGVFLPALVAMAGFVLYGIYWLFT
jgi:hypothetical protein